VVSIWHLAQRNQLRASPHGLHTFDDQDKRHTVAATESALWVITELSPSNCIAFRVAFSPDQLSVEGVSAASDGSSVEIEMTSTIGRQTARVSIDRSDGTISSSTTLDATEDLTVDGWPRDVVADLDDLEGTVHTTQRGLRTGLVHATVAAPVNTTFMYLQDLSKLGDYFHGVHASGKDTVGGEWPELGFALPPGDSPVKAGEPTLISNWHVAFADAAGPHPAEIAEQYLTLLARLFMHIDRPEPGYVDWRKRAEQSHADLDTCEKCWITIDGKRYLRAYVGDDNHPPESMVQLAVLMPLAERSRWCGIDDPLVEELAALAPEFHDDRINSIARWLPTAENMLDGGEPHEFPRLMDSWYLFHPLLNLARLADERDDDDARKQFLESLDHVIDVAHHFDHNWPVFYDVDTLEVIKAESEPGKGGELDVPGLYAHVMIQAYEMTDEERYLDEANTALRSMLGKGFELTYQTNNVAFGMLAALKMYQRTGDEELLQLSHVLCACLFDNVGLWSTRYGHARDRASFFGVFPMPTAPYTAAYEQAEVAAVCLEYILRAGDELPDSLKVLLPELIRHVTARLDTYYPPCIPDEALTDSPKTGCMLRDVWIPVEDLADGWDEAGTVGQEVYGAGIAFSTVARSYIRVPDSSAQVYCEYPYRVVHADRRSVVLHVYGDPGLACRMRLLPDGGWSGDERVEGSATGRIDVKAEGRRWRDYMVPAGQDVTVTWID